MGGAFREVGLRVGQDMLLSRLWREDGLTQSELVERLGVEPATVSKVLSRMEGAGLVARRRDPRDARSSRVYLTERGRSLREPTSQAWEEAEERMLEGFAPEERVLLGRLLARVRENLSGDPSRARTP
ncbi:MAG: MarR family transcriptional regulator [Actinomycetota bacterium]|nr:MarR family transcriptional regulator [Actinomycetota bacterium]